MVFENLVSKVIKDKKLVQPVAFALTIFTVYGSWKVIYYFLNAPGSAIHSQWVHFTNWFAYVHLVVTGKICSLLGFDVTYKLPDIFYLNHSRGVVIAEHCLAVPALYVFTFSVVFFPGGWQNKWWFLLVGIAGIFLINITRLVLIGITLLYAPASTFLFFHSFFYVLITYSLIFLLFAWWINRFMLRQDESVGAKTV